MCVCGAQVSEVTGSSRAGVTGSSEAPNLSGENLTPTLSKTAPNRVISQPSGAWGLNES